MSIDPRQSSTDVRGSTDVRDRIDALFGDGPPPRRWPRRLVAALVAVTLVGAAAGVAAARSGSASSSQYRTATASVADVTASWSGVASIEPVSQAAVAFPTSGTVATVDVGVGNAVTVGATLATLDTTTLETDLHQRQAALDQANLTLSTALNDGTSTGTSSTASSVTTTSQVAATPVAGGGSDLAAAQKAVIDAQRAVDAAMATSNAKLAAADAVCVGDVASDASTTDSTTTTPSSTTSTTTTTTSPDDGTAACRTALGDVAAAQHAVSQAQPTLASAMETLDGLLTSSASGQSSSAAGGTAATKTGTTAGASSNSTGSGAAASAEPGAGSSSPSSADLVSYQRAVDAAEMQVAVAEQALAQARIVAPIAGTVVSITMEPGDDVTAGSSTQLVTIQGEGGYEATAVVPLADMTGIAVGNAARLTPDGTHSALAGTVVAVAATPTTSSGSSSSAGFRVTIGIKDPDADVLRNGSTGTVTITTDQATRALTVPTSAVTTRGARRTVTTLRSDGSTRNVPVEVGVVGPKRTQITDGLSAGSVVVLADLDEPLPSSATDTTSSSSSRKRSGQAQGFLSPPAGFGGRPGG